MQLTHEQEECRDTAIEMRPGDSMSIVAFAGAGKTSTLLEIIRCLDQIQHPSGRKSLGVYCAFNNSVAKSAEARLTGVNCASKTMHAIAMAALKEVNNSPDGKAYTMTINDIREFAGKRVLGNNWKTPVQGWSENRILHAAMKTVTKYCISTDDNIYPHHARAALIDMIGDPDTMKSPELIAKAQYAIKKLSDKIVDLAKTYFMHLYTNDYYTYDLAMKVLELDPGLRNRTFGNVDYVVVDEAQDIDAVQISLIKKLGAKTIVVGDPYQAIYSWRGAKNALDQFDGKKLFLTQSFRFDERIAEIARRILAARPDGGPKQRLIGAGDNVQRSPTKRAVICRTNAGMFVEAQKMITRGIDFHIEKSDTLLSEIKSATALRNGDRYQVSGRLSSFDNWKQVVAESEAGDGSLGRLVEIIEGNQIDDMVKTIQAGSRKHGKDQVKIITAHGAKGDEFGEVRLGDDFKNVYELRDRYERALTKSQAQADQALEQFNVLYVGATRTEDQLYAYKQILEEPDGGLRRDPPEEPVETPELSVAGM